MQNSEPAYERKTIPQAWSSVEKDELLRLRLEEGRDWPEISAKLGRSEAAVKSKFKYVQFDRSVRAPEPIPVVAMTEQARRVIAWGERTLTAVICGDPAPGWSALERRAPEIS